MGIKISAAVGATPAANANKPEDVKRIQSMLNAVNGINRVSVTGKCDPATIKSIGEFQGLWTGRVDSRVDPGGRTLTRLNQVATPLTLGNISLGRIKYGGYLISYTGEVAPKEFTLHLGVLPGSKIIDVTGRKKTDLISNDNLPVLLKLISEQNLWGKKVQCRLLVKRNGKLVTQSKIQTLDAPVKPYTGTLKPELGKPDGGPQYTYTGIATGRMLYQPAIDGNYYFAYGGKFETDNAMRGLNCITYAGAAFGVDPASGAMSSYGTQLADKIKATKCDMENKKEAEIKGFFKTHETATYIMWSSTHVVLVVKGVIHEFSQSKNGYAVTDAQEWNYHGKSYWVRKTPKAF